MLAGYTVLQYPSCLRLASLTYKQLIRFLAKPFFGLYSAVLWSRSRIIWSEPHQNFYSEPEPHKNDAASQHWYSVNVAYTFLQRFVVVGKLFYCTMHFFLGQTNFRRRLEVLCSFQIGYIVVKFVKIYSILYSTNRFSHTNYSHLLIYV
jgi:hypothetical protein